jgi:hypothetical protein
VFCTEVDPEAGPSHKMATYDHLPSLCMDGLSISEDLVPPRPIKHPGTTEISFKGLLDPPLKLHEDLKEGCGGQLWPAGKVLAEYLLRRIGSLDRKTMFVFSQAIQCYYR